MTWKKYFQSQTKLEKYSELVKRQNNDPSMSAHVNSYSSRFQSWLPDVYTGQPNRIQRYGQYDNMNLDTEVANALDTISDACTQEDDESGYPFEMDYAHNISQEEVELLDEMLRQWYEINEWDKRAWRLFRNMIMYGDQFLLRDPETFKLFWIDQTKVQSVIVDESKGKRPEKYVITDLDPNLQTLVATNNSKNPPNNRGYSTGPLASGQYDGSFTNQLNQPGRTNTIGYTGSSGASYEVDSDYIVHISLSEGLDNVWPFGTSILESVYKTFKKKELIEDAVVIYRVQRAPERRVFYVDVGRMPTNKANAYLERIKNEIQQKRIPSRTGGGSSILDATYNPMSMLEDYFFAQNADGKGSRVETLPGGEQLGEIDDLKYFNQQMRIGLRIPRSYLPEVNDGGGAMFNDGRIGTSYIEEFKFSRYCERLQNMFINPLNLEFKLFCKNRGVNIHASSFNLKLVKPQNFSKYRMIELNSTLLDVYSKVADIPHISRRFGLMKYAGWSEDDILKNEKMWAQENPGKVKPTGLKAGTGGNAGTNISFGDTGASAAGIPDESLNSDEGENAEIDLNIEAGSESPISGAENSPPEEGEAEV